MDCEVFILSRMREPYDEHGSTPRAVVDGISYTGRLVTSAALILFLAFVALSTIPAVEVKILATALALGVAIDAVVVRTVLGTRLGRALRQGELVAAGAAGSGAPGQTILRYRAVERTWLTSTPILELAWTQFGHSFPSFPANSKITVGGGGILGGMQRRGASSRRPGLSARVARVEAAVSGGFAVLEPDRDRPSAGTLWIDDVPQSHVDLADPSYLSFEYVRQIGDVIDTVFPSGRPIAALHLGGGALTLPRYVAVTRPGSTQRVAELDDLLITLVRAELPIDPSYRIKISTADARALLERQRPALLDLVVVDVFARGQVPPSVVSTESFAALARVLRSPGVAVINIADGKPLEFARSVVASARTAFNALALLAEPTIWRGRRFGNLVLVASAAALPIDALRRRLAGGVWPARLVDAADLLTFQGSADVRTDADTSPTPRPPAQVFDALRPPARSVGR